MKNRIDYLDSVRGLAALSVVFFHLLISMGLGSLSDYRPILVAAPFHIIWDGAAAVSMFFVLSGFVLSLKYINQDPVTASYKSININDYYIARFFRLVLPFFCVLVCAELTRAYLFTSLNDVPLITNNLREHWDATSPKANEPFLLQAILIFPGTKHFLLPQGWTLTVEALISLLIPFLILIARNGVGWLFTYITIILLICNAGKSIFELKFLFHFALGITLARYWPYIQEKANSWSLLTKSILFITGLYFYQYRFVDPSLLIVEIARPHIWYLTGFGSFLILIWIFSCKIAQNILKKPSLMYLGKVSYSLYLTHYIVILVATPKLILLLEPYIDKLNVLHGIVFMLSLLIILISSHLSYMLFENPSQKLSILVRHTVVPAISTRLHKWKPSR